MAEPLKGYETGRYSRLSTFFRREFGRPVYKIPLDAGFSCPNRDGTIGRGGCTYCHNPAFAPRSKGAPLPVGEQILRGKSKKHRAGYLAYFQAYTNTYASPEKLRNLYDGALSDPDVLGMSIATRPDCVSKEILDLLESYARRCHLWVEYGLQSAHDQTLRRVNRGHSVSDFAQAVEQTRNRGIYVCAHVIIGLPGETPGMFLKTMDFINRCGLDGIKFHHLQVIAGTPLADEFARGRCGVFEKSSDYVPLLCDCLERLSPKIVVHRLAASATSNELLIAPHWPESATQIAAAVEQEMKNRNSYQGAHFSHPG